MAVRNTTPGGKIVAVQKNQGETRNVALTRDFKKVHHHRPSFLRQARRRLRQSRQLLREPLVITACRARASRPATRNAPPMLRCAALMAGPTVRIDPCSPQNADAETQNANALRSFFPPAATRSSASVAGWLPGAAAAPHRHERPTPVFPCSVHSVLSCLCFPVLCTGVWPFDFLCYMCE